MLQILTLPASWRALLEALRPSFRRSSTFALFALLATGLVAQTMRRTVVGMLAGASMATVVSFHSACRFFSHHAWQADRLGLLLARQVVARLLDPQAPIVVAVDDTLFRRWGRKVHHAFWTHDGAAPGPIKVGRGNRWVIAAIVVHLPFCSHPVCLPVLFRLWAGKGSASPVDLAANLLAVLAAEFGPRPIHAVGDAAYHGKQLLVDGTTITTRLPVNAVLFDLPPGRRRAPGRPALKGARLGRPADLAATATWRRHTVTRYGRTETVDVAVIDSIWYGAFRNSRGRTVLVREPGSPTATELALFTTDRTSPPQDVIARYADRWSIECAIATGKQLLGIGQARNRVPRAVERTVPFAFCVQTLVITWYTVSGHHPDDLASRLAAQPWYTTKAEPSFEDMLAKLRRTLIAARFTATRAEQPDPHIIRDYALACAAAAA